MKRAYISGKITGLSVKEYTAKFSAMEKLLRAKGYEVVNPVTLIRNELGAAPEWKACMRVALRELLTCDEIHLLPCWKDSTGAKMEFDTATRLGIKVINYLEKDL